MPPYNLIKLYKNIFILLFTVMQIFVKTFGQFCILTFIFINNIFLPIVKKELKVIDDNKELKITK